MTVQYIQHMTVQYIAIVSNVHECSMHSVSQSYYRLVDILIF